MHGCSSLLRGSASLSPDGRYVVEAHRFGNARVWDVMRGEDEELAVIEYDEQLYDFALSLDGAFLLLQFSGRTTIWDVSSGELVTTIDGSGTSFFFSPDGNYLAIGNVREGGTIWQISNDENGFNLSKIEDLELDCARDIGFSSDSRFLITSCYSPNAGPNLRLWDIEEQRLIDSFEIEGVEGIAVSTDASYIAVVIDEPGHFDHTIRVIDVASGRARQFRNFGGGSANFQFSTPAVTFRPQKHELIGGSHLWELAGHTDAVHMEHEGEVVGVAYSLDESLLTSVTISQPENNQANTPESLSQNGDQSFIARPQIDVQFQSLDIETNSEVATAIQAILADSLTFSADGQYFAAAIDEGTVHLSKVVNPEEAVEFEYTGFLEAISLSQDGRLLAIAADGHVDVWDVPTRKKVASFFYDGLAWSIVLGQEDWYLATYNLRITNPGERTHSENWTLQFWDIKNGQQIWSDSDPSGSPLLFTLSPDGTYLASVDPQRLNRQVVTIVEIASGQELAVVGHEGSTIAAFAFSKDGRQLATSALDGTARVWDVVSGREINRIQHDRNPSMIDISPNGKYLTIIDGNMIQSWLLQPKDLIAEACALLDRNLTRDEWAQHIGDELYRPTCNNIPLDPA